MAANPRSEPTVFTPAPASKAALWTGWILSGLLAFFLLTGSVTAFSGSPQVAQGMAKFGFSLSILRPIAVLEFVCPVLYLIPRTAVFGAILLTAYMGGAVVAHARIGDPMWMVPVVFGVIVWIALLLRQPRLRSLVLNPSSGRLG